MKRILLKLSGEFLQNERALWASDKVALIVDQIVRLNREKVQIGLVVGGGNIFRGGRNTYHFDRYVGDRIGMAATCVNALFLKACLQEKGVNAIVCGDFLTGADIVHVNAESVQKYFSEGTVVLFSGGTGFSFFSTDTAAALRAIEMKADVLLKGTKVDGVYDKDPCIYEDAKKFERLTYRQVFEQRYDVMDASAFALCWEQKMPIFIFNLDAKDAIYNAVYQPQMGTFIEE